MTKIEKLRRNLPQGIEAGLFADPSNRRYFTGFPSSAGTVLFTPGSAYLIIDFRYFEAAQKQVTEVEVIQQEDLYGQILELLKRDGVAALALDNRQVSLQAAADYEEHLPGIQVIKDGRLGAAVDYTRRIKDEGELQNFRRAQDLTDEAFRHILGFIKPGRTELEIAMELTQYMLARGSETRSCNWIVASGPNSSLPHGFATERVVEKGDFVTMDFGALFEGYTADMTRTVAVGEISGEQRRVYEIVLEAQRRALEGVRAGAVCNEVDALARDYIYGEGYRGCFSHGLGHSVGIDVHENPRFNEVCTDRLEPNTVITVEPGIYLKGRFGVRIEDMVVVTQEGCDDLTHSDKELIVL